MIFQSDLLKGRVALITGGGTGICRGIALAFAAHGCDVAITSRTMEHLEPTAVELRALGIRAVAKTADVRDPSAVGDVVSAHLRSLQGDHLIDVQSTDQHTVKPWFNGRLDVAPPVIDLTPQGFTLIGGRLDYIDGRPVAAIVYKRRAHVINLFVSQTVGSEHAAIESLQGFNVWRWAWSDLSFRAVSDINTEELREFGDKLETAVRTGGS